jgi:hypothetical protein
MTISLPERIQRVAELAANPVTTPEMRVIADAILYLATQEVRQRQNNLTAFEQIEELDKRQGPAAAKHSNPDAYKGVEGAYFHNS